MRTHALVLFLTVATVTAVGQAQYKVLWSFGSIANDGFEPVSGLIFDGNGNLYGTTEAGGSGSIPSGTVFKLSPNEDGTWSETIIYSFCSISGCTDGAAPVAGLVFDQGGNLYGTTIGGGTNYCQSAQGNCGTVFELSPPTAQGGAWTETVLYNFCSEGLKGGCQDGAEPTSQLTIDDSGNLYGTTTTGGTGGMNNVCCWGGTVFELSQKGGGWTHTILYNFCATGKDDICPDGAGPQAGVRFDRAGNLYGTTQGGGDLKAAGGGTLYKLSRGSNGWVETVLTGSGVPPQKGCCPLGEVTLDGSGNLYSTFSFGGANFNGGVFRYSAKSNEFATFSFNGTNGQTPSAGVLLDPKNAVLYGTTRRNAQGSGNVFQIVAPAEETVLYNFCSQPNCADGATPLGDLISDSDGNLYGTASLGGANDQGVVFEVTPSTGRVSTTSKAHSTK